MRFVIGDIHGCGLELETLVYKVLPVKSDDEIILVGDLFDRAMHPLEVWHVAQNPLVTSLLGNHEMKMLRYLKRERDSVPPHYHWALQQLCGPEGPGQARLIAFLESMPTIKIYDDAIVVHAGINLQNPDDPDPKYTVYGNLPPEMKLRPHKGQNSDHWFDLYRGEKLVVYGHLCEEDGSVRYRYGNGGRMNSVGIDTSVAWGGSLTAFSIETGGVYQYRSGIPWIKQLRAVTDLEPPYYSP